MMGLIKSLLNHFKDKKRKINTACDHLIDTIDNLLQEKRTFLSDEQAYMEQYKEKEWVDCSSRIIADCNSGKYQKLKKAVHYKKLWEKQQELQRSAYSFQQEIREHNGRVLNKRIENAYALIGNVEKRQLDRQQMSCIVKDVHNHLVIAGAGTGKTTTIVGKIKYLLKSGKYRPEDILVLSFTNASASEMSQRIHRETGCNIAASTFHKLGLNILTQVDGVVPRITNINMRKFIREEMRRNMQLDEYLDSLNSYVLFDSVIPRSEFEFQTQDEYEEYLKWNPPTTIKGEVVKSYGELDIANYLTQKGVEYRYEHPYKVDTRTKEYGQYKPDFYLPEFDIYIEYFGINREGEVPSYFKDANGMTATQKYQESMKWKQKVHKENETVMIECYAYEKLEGNLIESLQKKLADNGVQLVPRTAREVWEQIAKNADSVLDGIIELFETVINLMKSNDYTISAVRQLNVNTIYSAVNEEVLVLLEPIYRAYCSFLNEHQEIDFNDMINMAIKYIEQKKYVNPYKYIIVDEYQDISKARFMLLDSMRKSKDYDLFCVGDDWQSIYRFAGSDIGFILHFGHYWGKTEISKIETTYRFAQKLIEVSSNFIMENPMQIKKSIRGKSNETGFAIGEINGYKEKYSIRFMAAKLDDLPRNSSVFLIGRYSFDIKMLDEDDEFSYQYNNVSGLIDVVYCKRTDLKISFVTAHKSKGLQADYVFIINNKCSKMGFPSKIQDAPILDLLLEGCDQYPYGEERRLFYVALTRARKKAFLVTVNQQESEFVMELRQRYGQELKREPFECPLCGGRLLKKSGPYGDFFGCSNYKVNGCTYKRKIK